MVSRWQCCTDKGLLMWVLSCKLQLVRVFIIISVSDKYGSRQCGPPNKTTCRTIRIDLFNAKKGKSINGSINKKYLEYLVCFLWVICHSVTFMILVSIIQYSCMSAAFEEQRKHNCSCKEHKIVLGRRNLRNDGVDCYWAVMAMSKQGYDCEWRGVSVFCVCVCLWWDTGYAFPYLSVWLWVATHVWLHNSMCRLPVWECV